MSYIGWGDSTVRTDGVHELLSTVKHTGPVLTWVWISGCLSTVSVHAKRLQFVIKEQRTSEKGSDIIFHSARKSSLPCSSCLVTGHTVRLGRDASPSSRLLRSCAPVEWTAWHPVHQLPLPRVPQDGDCPGPGAAVGCWFSRRRGWLEPSGGTGHNRAQQNSRTRPQWTYPAPAPGPAWFKGRRFLCKHPLRTLQKRRSVAILGIL